ncbi:hypothetical protein F3Y22_tig00111276pilonHSYRG00029 [Hibiscus syriacus]|uniref:Myb/SANT-like DNA-binding domain-containing protein n=1 Tax=Hibiscus syriacus TaxID=106335 RepID=A0A6A2YS54_HIBSY|nr:hypothetical protein F3Y22_tig00111276pilonHSYRG00029 [Hibiscus syriacus]
MEMGDQYGLPDLQRLLTSSTHFPRPTCSAMGLQCLAVCLGLAPAPPPLLLLQLLLVVVVGGVWEVSKAETAGGRGKNSLEIRSRLDSMFKGANQKGPLWDEVSRIMAEEYGYMRSGKKCREKFENLYKYYKKTKEGKAGRQDGKNYRFFKQLEAICGETSNPPSSVPETSTNVPSNPQQEESIQERKISESLGFSEFDNSLSEDEDGGQRSAFAFTENQKRVKKGWKKWKVKDFVDSQMKKLLDSQDVWMERMLKVIEEKEQERSSKEEWRRRKAARFDAAHELWVKERAWIEVRDAALMEAVRKLSKTQNEINRNRPNEHEISTLGRRFQENNGYSNQNTWEEIEAKMMSSGYERETNNAECYKKHKEGHFQQLESSIDGEENKSVYGAKHMDSSSPPSSSYDINSFHISAVSQGDQWDRNGLKMMSEGKNQQS